MRKQDLLWFAVTFLTATFSLAQSVSVNSTGDAADPSAVLDVAGAGGVLIPRMTATERGDIDAPATGLMVYQTTEPTGFYYNQGTSLAPDWIRVQPSSNDLTKQGNTFNGASQLVRMDATGKLPAVDGSQLTNLPSAGGASFLFSGWFANATTTTYEFPVVFSNVQPPNSGTGKFPSVEMITFIPSAGGVIDNLLVRQVPSLALIGSATGTVTVTLYKNGAPTSLSCSFTNVVGADQTATGTDYDGGHAVSVAAGDKLYFMVNQGSIGATTVIVLSTTVRFR